ncbi:MAG: hypothetical protein ACP5HU_04850, partial [Phycisphaerae bacterium]
MDEPSDNHRRAEALRAMAEGLGDQPDDEKDSGQQQGEVEQAEDSPAVSEDFPLEDDPALPVARPATNTRPAKVGAHHKLMVPLLLAVAGVLLVLSAATLMKLLLGTPGGPLATYGWWLI